MSYFHEYATIKKGIKTLRNFSRPFDLSKFDSSWVTREDELWDLGTALDESPHREIVSSAQVRRLRPITDIEKRASSMTEWQKPKNKK